MKQNLTKEKLKAIENNTKEIKEYERKIRELRRNNEELLSATDFVDRLDLWCSCHNELESIISKWYIFNIEEVSFDSNYIVISCEDRDGECSIFDEEIPLEDFLNFSVEDLKIKKKLEKDKKQKESILKEMAHKKQQIEELQKKIETYH